MDRRRDAGMMAESLAAAYLVGKGFRIIERNYRCRWGEIDIIAQKDGKWVFVEVRSRRNPMFGRPSETIDFFKRRKINRTASRYLWEHRYTHYDVRFDVVTVEGRAYNRIIEHIAEAWGW